MRYIVVVLWLLVLTITGYSAEYFVMVDNAKAYYKLGVSEHGNIEAFRAAKRYLKQADKLIDKLEFDNEISKNAAKQIRERIDTLRNDISFQEEMAKDTFYGMLQTARIFASNVFIDSAGLASYDIFDEPEVVAVSKAAGNAIASLQKQVQYLDSKIEVVVLSSTNNHKLENEVRYLFNHSPNFYALSQTEIDQILNSNNTNKSSILDYFNSLAKNFGRELNTDNLLIAVINDKSLDNSELYFYEIQTALLSRGGDTPQAAFFTGFCRSNSNLKKYLIGVFLLAVFVILFIATLGHYNDISRLKFHRRIIALFFVFIIGLFSPLIINYLVLQSFSPLPESLFIVSFWWVILLSVIIVIVPQVAVYFIFRYTVFFSYIKEHIGLFKNIIISTAIGSSCLVASIMIINERDLNGYNIMYILSLIANIIFVGVVFGRIAIDKLSYTSAILCLLQVLCFGAGLIITKNTWVYPIVVGTLVLFEIPIFKKLSLKSQDESDGSVLSNAMNPKSFSLGISEIKEQMILHKNYYDAFNIIQELDLENKWYNILGESGSGKSALACKIVSTIENKLIESKNKFSTYSISCSSSSEPLGAFENFIIENLPKSIENVGASILRNLNSSLLKNYDNVESIRPRLFKTFSDKLSEKNIIIRIDDIMNIDDSSKELLIDLYQTFHNVNISQNRLFVIISGIGKVFTASEIGKCCDIHLEKMSEDDRENLLKQEYSFSELTANRIIKETRPEYERSQMHSVVNAICALISENAFVQNGECIDLSKEFDNVNVPISSLYKEYIESYLDKSLKIKKVLTCAVCIGYDFSARIISEVTGIEFIEVLDILANIESELEWIKEDINSEMGIISDIFEGRYLFVYREFLKTLSELLRVNSIPSDPVSYIAKEYRRLIADYYVKSNIENTDLRYLQYIATHYYIGCNQDCADKAIEYNIKALKYCNEGNFFPEAKKFYNQLNELKCRGYANDHDFEDLRIEIMIVESYVTRSYESKIDKAEAAMESFEYYELNKPHIDEYLAVKILRAQHDARHIENYDFKEKAKKMIQELYKSNNKEIVTEAMHFDGLVNNNSHKLKVAINECENIGIKDNFYVRRLYARIKNSLAFILHYGESNDSYDYIECLCLESLKIKEEEPKDYVGITITRNLLGGVFLKQDEYHKALENAKESYIVSTKFTNNAHGEIISLNIIAMTIFKCAESSSFDFSCENKQFIIDLIAKIRDNNVDNIDLTDATQLFGISKQIFTKILEIMDTYQVIDSEEENTANNGIENCNMKLISTSTDKV